MSDPKHEGLWHVSFRGEAMVCYDGEHLYHYIDWGNNEGYGYVDKTGRVRRYGHYVGDASEIIFIAPAVEGPGGWAIRLEDGGEDGLVGGGG